MARLTTRTSDNNVTNDDLLAGVDTTTRSSRKIPVRSLAEGLAASGTADPAKETLISEFQRDDISGLASGYFFIPGLAPGTNTVTLDIDVTEMVISNRNVNGTNFRALLDKVNGGEIKITDPIDESNFAFYGVSAVADYQDSDNIINPNFAQLTVEFDRASANGARFDVGQRYGITPIFGGSGTGGQTNQNAFSNIAVAGQTEIEADRETDTFTVAAGPGVTLTTDALTDTLTITSDGTHPHTNTFNGSIANRTLTITGSDIPVNNVIITHSAGFTYAIDGVKLPSGWGVAAIDLTADPNNFSFTVPSSATAGSYGVEVTYTSTETSTSTTHRDVISFNVILQPAPVSYFTQSSTTNITGNQTLTSSPWVEVAENVVTGTTLLFIRPTGHTGTYYGGVGIRTSGTGAVVIDAEASFDEGTSVPDIISTGVTPTGYTVFTFPLHLPRTSISISTF